MDIAHQGIVFSKLNNTKIRTNYLSLPFYRAEQRSHHGSFTTTGAKLTKVYEQYNDCNKAYQKCPPVTGHERYWAFFELRLNFFCV